MYECTGRRDVSSRRVTWEDAGLTKDRFEETKGGPATRRKYKVRPRVEQPEDNNLRELRARPSVII